MSRRRRFAAAALLAIAALLALAVSAATATAAGIGSGPSTAAEKFIFGISDGSPIFPYEGSIDADRLAQLEHEVGAEAGRFTLRWDLVQPTTPPPLGPPRYEWQASDDLVSALRRQRIAPLPMILGAPGWAREPGCSGICPPAPEHLADFGLFVSAVVARYYDSAAIEIWNEPNLAVNWAGGDGPDAAAYARLFEAARSASLRLGPKTPILIGGLAFPLESAQAEGSLAAGAWLGDFYAAADAGDLDLADDRIALALHPYPGLDELAGANPHGRFTETLAAARAAIAAGDPNPERKIWVTETGVSTTAPGPEGTTTPPDLQASALVHYLDLLERAPDVAAAFIYTMVDRPPQDSAAEEGFGLVGRGPDFSPKPAFCALARARGRSQPQRCTTG